jgi:predicted DNA binding CopG/RHH family protein
MPVANELAPDLLERTVGKKKVDSESQELRQVNIRLATGLYSRVEATAEALSLDVAQFLRMVIRRALPEYESQADEVRRAEGKGG